MIKELVFARISRSYLTICAADLHVSDLARQIDLNVCPVSNLGFKLIGSGLSVPLAARTRRVHKTIPITKCTRDYDSACLTGKL